MIFSDPDPDKIRMDPEKSESDPPKKHPKTQVWGYGTKTSFFNL